MFPVLFEIGPIKIYSFGFMLVVTFYSTYFLLNHDLKRLSHNEKLASDMIFWAAIGGIIGSKIYYLLENLGDVIQDPVGMIFSGSGLVFLGGLMGGTLAVTMVLRKNNRSVLFHTPELIKALLYQQRRATEDYFFLKPWLRPKFRP